MVRQLSISLTPVYSEASRADAQTKTLSNQTHCGGCPPSPCSTRDSAELVEKVRWADFSSDEESDALVPQQRCSASDEDCEGDCPSSPCSTAAPEEFASKRRWADFSSDEEFDVIRSEQRWSPCEARGEDDSARSLCFPEDLLQSGSTTGANDVGAKQTLPSRAEAVATLVTPSRPSFSRPNREKKHVRDIQLLESQEDSGEGWQQIGSRKKTHDSAKVGRQTSDGQVLTRRARGRKQKMEGELADHSSQQLKMDNRTLRPTFSTTSKPSAPHASGRVSKNAPRRQDRSRGATQCQFFIGIEEDADFSVVRKVLGSHGANVKRIAEQTGAKLRLRGHGSGFLEGPEKKESSDPLMLCVSALDVPSYQLAKDMVTDVLEKVYEQRREYCRRKGKEPSNVRISFHEGYRPGAR